MSEGTTIEWTHYTFNPWWGCVRVSPGCEHCYAERDAKRYGYRVWGPEAPRRFLAHFRGSFQCALPRKRREGGDKHLVFCASMADVFEDDRRLDEHRHRLWDLIRATPELTWQLLTKRPENFDKLAPGGWVLSGWPPNVWLGVTAENQEYADRRIPLLLCHRAARHWVSYEPALGPVDFDLYHRMFRRGPDGTKVYLPRIDWVIVGGESGPGARPFDVAWARETVRQCREAGVACFVKQLGAKARTSDRDSWDYLNLKSRKGGDPAEWPEDLRVREFPA